METALLGGESSGAASDFASERHHYYRRSDAITFGSSYQKAAALVDLAEDGTGIPEEILDQPNFESAAKSYFIFIRFDFLWSLNCFALIALSFLEKPLWCGVKSEITCSNREYYFLGQLPYLTGAESLVYEIFDMYQYHLASADAMYMLILSMGTTLIVLVVHTLFPISYEGFHLYWKSHVNKLKVISLLILVADFLVYVLYLSPIAFYYPLRLAPYIRVVIFILNFRELRDSVLILAGMLGTYLNVLALSLLFLLFASWLAYIIFEDTLQGNTIFTSYGVTLYQMFVLFTTSNNPDVWIPAYKLSRWSALFFVLYILLGVYFVTNLILAVVYDSFKCQLAMQVGEKDRMRIRILAKAFTLIDSYNLGYLNKNQCMRLFKELNTYRSLPKISTEDFELIFDELDDTHDFKINADEFADLCNAIALRFQKEDSVPWLQRFQFYNSDLSVKLKDFVKGPMFEYTIVFLLFLNFVAVIIETTLDIADSSTQTFWQEVEFIYGWIYVLEMMLKVYSYGLQNYWRDGQNRFDFIITWVIVIGETTTFISPKGLTFLSNGEWIRYLLIARMLRLIRLLMYVKRYRAFVATFLTLIPSLMPYLGTIFCVLCIYCSLGLQVFGGIVNAGNPDLSSSELAENDYLLFNFNDYPNGMVTLFNLLVMGNWQAWMQGYKELTGTVWTYVYFISFYLITVLLLLNLIVAFVLEAFFAELELESCDQSQEDDKDIGEKNRPRNMGMKRRSQRVDMLLHHMLSAELREAPDTP